MHCAGVAKHYRAAPGATTAGTEAIIAALVGAGVDADGAPTGIGATRAVARTVQRIVRAAKEDGAAQRRARGELNLFVPLHVPQILLTI